MSDPPQGVVQGLYIAAAASAPPQAVEIVEAVAGRGLAGDRYFLGNGFYSGKPGWGASVTLIESEAIAAINAGHNKNFTAAMLRRNILTVGIKLESLLGREFRCGAAILRGTKVFPPCKHLADLIGEPLILRYLAYCGGVGADVLSDGAIKLDDELSLIA